MEATRRFATTGGTDDPTVGATTGTDPDSTTSTDPDSTGSTDTTQLATDQDTLQQDEQQEAQDVQSGNYTAASDDAQQAYQQSETVAGEGGPDNTDDTWTAQLDESYAASDQQTAQKNVTYRCQLRRLHFRQSRHGCSRRAALWRRGHWRGADCRQLGRLGRVRKCNRRGDGHANGRCSGG